MALLSGDTETAAAKAINAVEVLQAAADPRRIGDAYLVLARVQDELGELERAERSYNRAVEEFTATGNQRELAKAYRWFGKFLKRLGRADAALEAFELAADLTPSTLDSLAPGARPHRLPHALACIKGARHLLCMCAVCCISVAF